MLTYLLMMQHLHTISFSPPSHGDKSAVLQKRRPLKRAENPVYGVSLTSPVIHLRAICA
jgi:hypothetical protein